MEFDQYAVLFLIRKEPPPPLSDSESDAVQDAHLAHLARLHETGALLAAGPVRGSNRSRIAGVCIFRGSVENAHALEREDPAVTAGFFELEGVAWSVPAGTMRFEPSRFPRSMRDALSP